MEGTDWSSLWITAAYREDSHWRRSQTVSHRRNLPLEEVKSVRSSSSEERGEAETMCDELTTIPIPWEVRSKAELGKNGQVGRMCFKIWFYSSLPCPDVTGNKLISPGQICFSHDRNCWVISFYPYLNLWGSFNFFTLIQLRKGNNKSDLVRHMASSHSLPTTDTHLWDHVVWPCGEHQSSSLNITAFPSVPGDYTFLALASRDLLGNNVEFLLQFKKISHEMF